MRKGFTLLELLASVAVLGIVVALMAVLFADSQAAWQLGADRAKTSSTARTALDMLTHDLEHAVSVDTFTFMLERSTNLFYEIDNHELAFVSLQNDTTDGNPAAVEIQYWVREMTNSSGQPLGRYELVRGCDIPDTGADSSLYSSNWYAAGRPPFVGILAENVAAFRLAAVDHDGQACDTYFSSSAHNSNRLPRYVDIYLELLDEGAAKRAAAMIQGGTTPTNLVDTHARRYATRAYFHNSSGYKQR